MSDANIYIFVVIMFFFRGAPGAAWGGEAR
jgi:hypothetical protein